MRAALRRLHVALVPAALLLGAAGPVAADPSPVVAREFIYESAPYPQAHASTIVETSAGTLAAAWFGGTRESNPDVSIYVARHEKGAWQRPVKVADGVQGDGTRYPTWNPVLFQAPDGPLLLFYKVGPSPTKWWGMVTRSTDDGRSWSTPQRLPDGILGPIKNKPVVLADGSWLAPSSVETEDGRWTLHFERSTDRGKSWIASPAVASPEHIDAIQPSILFHEDGSLEAIARTRQGALAMTWSKDGGKSWSPLAAIDLPNPNSGTDAVTLADGRQLLVYNHSAHSPDRPGKGPRYPLNVALSDDGIRWRPVLTLECKPLPAGYAYPAVIQTRDGLVHITYTYDRRRIGHIVLEPERLGGIVDPSRCGTDAPH
ncbi:MAG TPA: sialidase family protein [Sphingomonas sp.]|nr:sialidase family protein [Sphingomonas sp.]